MALSSPLGTSLAVQWLGPCAFTADGRGSIPGWGTEIPQAAAQPEKGKNKHFFKTMVFQTF